MEVNSGQLSSCVNNCIDFAEDNDKWETDPENEGDESLNQVTYHTRIITHIPGSYPTYLDGYGWTMSNTGSSNLLNRTTLNVTFEGERTNSRDKARRLIEKHIEEALDHIGQGKFPLICSEYSQINKETEDSIRSKIDFLHNVKSKVNVNSTEAEIFRNHDKLNYTAKDLISQVTNTIAEIFYHNDGITIEKEVKEMHELSGDERNSYINQMRIFDEATRKDLIPRLVENTRKPSIWMIIGNQQPDVNLDKQDTTRMVNTGYEFGNSSSSIKMRKSFGENFSFLCIPSMNVENSRKALRSISLFKTRVYRKLLDRQAECEASKEWQEPLTISFETARNEKDIGWNEKVDSNLMEKEEYVETQYEQLLSVESQLKSIVKSVERECIEDFIRNGDSDLLGEFATNTTSGFEFTQLNPEKAEKEGFLKWREIDDILEDEFGDIQNYRRHNRMKFGKIDQWLDGVVE